MTRLALIPVFVTGIQSTRVCAEGEALEPNDLVWLDFCEEHRDE
ncbi:integrase [Agrobacterium deltaense]|nr:integrase [Agrobacterium deltaense]